MQIVSKYALDKPPKLVEIIAAVPEEHRTTLLPQFALIPSSQSQSYEGRKAAAFACQGQRPHSEYTRCASHVGIGLIGTQASDILVLPIG